MMNDARQILQSRQLSVLEKDGMNVCTVKNSAEGIDAAAAIMNAVTDSMTALYLSGGSTPKPLYETFAREEKIKPGIVGLIDERYSDPLHENSNEKMIMQTGFIRYLSILDIQYYSMLRSLPLEKTAHRYDELYRSLGTVYRKSIGVLGIGTDGHTAGIAPERQDFHNRLFDKENVYEMVSWLDDDQGPYKKRITMTFLGLTMLDFLMVLVFGDEKKTALNKMFEPGSESEVPARFYLRKAIAPKTLLITDQSL
jgi:6-phosphogluconolactonase/glucosamine-6-phosphate isomerase/deaminase